MPWNLKFHEDTRIVELQISGRVKGDDLIAAANARIDLGKEKGVDRYIVDARDIDIPRSATLALHDIPARLYDDKGLSRSSAIAVLRPVSERSEWATSFFEDLCFNRGWRVESFDDRDRAIGWLLEPE